MIRDFSPQAALMGLIVAFVGFGSSFAVVLQGFRAVGASEAQAASGLMAAGIGMGLCGIVLSFATRMPVSAAWSTPGAAMLAGLPAGLYDFNTAVAGFMISAALIVLSGTIRPLGRLVAAIPASLANAMLAGVLLPLCLAPFQAIAFNPLLGLPILIAFALGAQVNKLLGVPAALLAFVAVLFFGIDFPPGWTSGISSALAPDPRLIAPAFSTAALFGIGLPLFIVTMASQNIPGLAVLHLNGYRPSTGRMLSATGLFTLLATPFGGHAVNLAAITAAMCAGEDAHPNPARRYWAAVISGFGYIVLSLLAGATVAFVSLAPAILIEAVAGVALFGAFTASAMTAFREESERLASAVTFLATASGVTMLGISGAFWGLAGGGAVLGLQRLAAPKP